MVRPSSPQVPTIDIYTTPQCGFCKQIKAMLKEQNRNFIEHDVTVSEEALTEMKEITQGALSVPVVVTDKGADAQMYAVGFEEAKVLLTMRDDAEGASKESSETVTLTCPECGHAQEGTIPTSACVPFYVCIGCKKTIQAAGNDCCVFCSYGDKLCPISNKNQGDCTDGSCSI